MASPDRTTPYPPSQTAALPAGASTTVPLSALVPTMHFDAQLVLQSEGRLPNYRAIAVPVLLFGGSDSPTYLQRTLDALETNLPRVRRVELLGVTVASSRWSNLLALGRRPRSSASVEGEPRTYTLRATQVYRREDGEWKVAHRYGDTVTE
jgi:hypothetical protein